MKTKKPKKSTVIFTALFALGIGIILYPTVSDWWNSHVQSKSIAMYDEAVANAGKKEQEAMLQAARDYNEALSALKDPLKDFGEIDGYDELLDITSSGVMGYLEIEKINVSLAIYHGTADSVLSMAAGHLEGTTLPIGGSGTHAVIVAHRGLPSARLFSDLDDLIIGDTFTITVLGETLTYEVDQIKAVQPNEVDDIQVVEGEDHVTLLTCTPYGINTERLLVRGVRAQTQETNSTVIKADAREVDLSVFVIAAVAALIPVAVILVRRKKRKR